MFKIFAVLCTLVNPDSTMASKPNCNTFYEDINRTFRTEEVCLEEALAKMETVVGLFEQQGVDFQSIMFGCEEIED